MNTESTTEVTDATLAMLRDTANAEWVATIDVDAAIMLALLDRIDEARADGTSINAALTRLEARHRPQWDKRCVECDMKVPPAGCPTWQIVQELRAALARPDRGDPSD